MFYSYNTVKRCKLTEPTFTKYKPFSMKKMPLFLENLDVDKEDLAFDKSFNGNNREFMTV